MKTTIEKEREILINGVKQNCILPYMTCPKCGIGDLHYSHASNEWYCAVQGCPFTTNQIPSIQEIRDLVKLKSDMHKINKWGI